MTKEELELWRQIHKLNTQVGFLQGILGGILYWDIPEELKERIKKALKDIEDDTDR